MRYSSDEGEALLLDVGRRSEFPDDSVFRGE